MADQIVARLRHIADDGQCDCHICDTAAAAANLIEEFDRHIAELLAAITELRQLLGE